MPIQTLTTDYGAELAYHVSPGRGPGVIFLTGFMSDMEGCKALRLEQHLRRRGNAFLRFDYRGHGRSSHRFEEGCIGDWAEDALTVLERLTEGPQVLVGSSMGGWIALLTALRRPQRIAGLLGVAPAPDFTRRIRDRYLDAEQRRILDREGRVTLASCYDPRPYTLTRHLIEEGQRHCLLDGPIDLKRPVRLIQGMEDADVPWQTALQIGEQLTGDDVELLFVKGGDHRLSTPGDLDRLCAVLDRLLDQLEAIPDLATPSR